MNTEKITAVDFAIGLLKDESLSTSDRYAKLMKEYGMSNGGASNTFFRARQKAGIKAPKRAAKVKKAAKKAAKKVAKSKPRAKKSLKATKKKVHGKPINKAPAVKLSHEAWNGKSPRFAVSVHAEDAARMKQLQDLIVDCGVLRAQGIINSLKGGNA